MRLEVFWQRQVVIVVELSYVEWMSVMFLILEKVGQHGWVFIYISVLPNKSTQRLSRYSLAYND